MLSLTNLLALTCTYPRVLDVEGAKCLDECPENQAVNLARKQCIILAADRNVCGQNTIELDIWSPNQRCACVPEHYVNAEKDGCVKECPAGYAISLDRWFCQKLDSWNQCGSNTKTLSSSKINQFCECKDYLTYLTPNSTACVLNCSGIQGLNLNKTQCIEFTKAQNGSYVCPLENMTTAVYFGMSSCQCQAPLVGKADGSGCAAQCDAGSALSRNRTMCQPLSENNTCGEDTIELDPTKEGQRCLCMPEMYINIEMYHQECRNSCPTYRVISLDGEFCKNKVENNSCESCGKGTVEVCGSSRPIKRCQCKPDYFLSTDKQSCLAECPAGEGLIMNGRECFPLTVNGYCGPNTVQLDQTKPGQVCQCLPNFYLNPDKTKCLSTCQNTTALNINRTQCIEQLTDSATGKPTCGFNTVVNKDKKIGNVCGCDQASGAVLNPTATDCINSCSSGYAKSLNRTQCVPVVFNETTKQFSCGPNTERMSPQLLGQSCNCIKGYTFSDITSQCVKSKSAGNSALIISAICLAGLAVIAAVVVVAFRASKKTAARQGYEAVPVSI